MTPETSESLFGTRKRQIAPDIRLSAIISNVGYLSMLAIAGLVVAHSPRREFERPCGDGVQYDLSFQVEIVGVLYLSVI